MKPSEEFNNLVKYKKKVEEVKAKALIEGYLTDTELAKDKIVKPELDEKSIEDGTTVDDLRKIDLIASFLYATELSSRIQDRAKFLFLQRRLGKIVYSKGGTVDRLNDLVNTP
jgi:hypothetical protein